MDWSQCSDVERVTGKVSGDWLVKGTRVQADGVIANAEAGCTAEEISNEIFEGLPVDRTRRIIAYAQNTTVFKLANRLAAVTVVALACRLTAQECA